MCSVLFLSLIVVILKGDDSVIPVLLRKQWARLSLHCDYDYVNFKYSFIYLIYCGEALCILVKCSAAELPSQPLHILKITHILDA